MGNIKGMETSMRIEVKSIFDRDGSRFVVVTENLVSGKMIISTHVFRDAEPFMSRRKDAPRLFDPMDHNAIEKIVNRQHRSVLDELGKKVMPQPGKGSHDFLEDARVFLRKRNNRKAYEVLKGAVELYPEDPHLLTYYGSLASIVDKKHNEGVAACRRAIRIVKERLPFGKEDVLPAFYVNLARAYSGGGDRQGAINALYEGTRYEQKEGMIHRELIKFGVRRPPPIPFLRRGNPINRYIGKLTFRN
jgi:predicted Zn-dependent protease